MLFTLQPGQWAVQVLTLLISPDLGSVNIYQGPGPVEGRGGQSENSVPWWGETINNVVWLVPQPRDFAGGRGVGSGERASWNV